MSALRCLDGFMWQNFVVAVLALAVAGKSKAARMAMMAITTSDAMSVNPATFRLGMA